MNLVKKILKAVGLLVLVVALVAGCVVGVKHFIGEKDAPDSDIYKVSAKRDSKYNGIYTLTKLDEDGNNTWDGLVCYVENDKIVSGGIVDYISNKELKKEEFGDENVEVSEDDLTSLILQRVTGLELGSIGDDFTGFGIDGMAVTEVKNGHTVGKMSYEAYKTKIDINDKNIYNVLYKSGLLGGYDEESQEVWLSKLINNEKSIFHEGYKLIHYKNDDDIQNRCVLNGVIIIGAFNEKFNANLD